MKNLTIFLGRKNHTVHLYTGLDGQICLDAEDDQGELVTYAKSKTDVNEALLRLDLALALEARNSRRRPDIANEPGPSPGAAGSRTAQ